MKGCLCIVIVVSLLFLSGCVSEKNYAAPSPSPTPIPTTIPTEKTLVPTVPSQSVPTVTQTIERDLDREFSEAAEVCYNNTPVITNIPTHEAFVTCMQNTPEPASVCAKNYRHNALKYTNDDGTTAGYQRITHNTRLFREAYYKNFTYNPIRQMFEPCS